MATIASLDIALGANSAKLKSDLDKANTHTKNFANKAKKNASDVTKAFQGIGAALVSIAAAVGVGALLQQADALQESANAANISFEAYQKLTFSLKMAGFSGETLQKSLVKLNGVMVSASKGSKGAQEELAAIGLTYQELEKLSPEKRFEAVVEGLDSIDDAGVRAVATSNLLGKEFANFKLDPNGLLAASANLVTVSDSAATAAAEFNDAVQLFQVNFGNIIVNAVAPFIEYITLAIGSINQFAANSPVMLQVVAGLAMLGVAVTTLGVAFTLAGIIPTAIALAIIAAISAIIYVTNNWDSIMRSFTEFLASTFGVSVETVNATLASMADWFWMIIGAVSEASNWIQSVLMIALDILVGTITSIISVWNSLYAAISSLFSLDFSGFAANMMNAFSTVKQWFVEVFASGVGSLVDLIKTSFSGAFASVANFFGEKIAAVVNWLGEKVYGIINGAMALLPNEGATFVPDDVPAGDGLSSTGGGGTWVGGRPRTIGEWVPLAAPTVGGGSSSSGMTTGVPITEAVLPPNEADIRTAEAVETLVEETTGGGNGGGGGGGSDRTTQQVAETTESISTAFMDHIKGAFSTALATGDWKGFLDSVLDNFTMNIIDQFSSGLMDALFGDTFDNIFENFGKQVSDGLSGALGGAAGGGGLFSGLLGTIGSWLGFADGGIVPSTPYSKIGRDSVPAMLMPGELVVPVDEVGNFLNGGAGNGSVVQNININGDISKQTEQKIYEMLPNIARGVNSFNKEMGSR